MKTHSGVGLALAGLLLVGAAEAQPYPQTASIANVVLWPGIAPGSENGPKEIKYSVFGNQGHRVFWNIATPMVAAFYAKKPNGAAVLIIPGGGYRALYVDSPPIDVAHWLNTLGVDAFVLMHRLPDEGHVRGYNVPLQDAQRAMRLIRSGKLLEGSGHKVDTARVGVMGFSAGGHLAAVLGTHYDEKIYDPVDDADALTARPDFMVLGYPALEMPQPIVASVLPNFYRMYQKYYLSSGINSSSPPAFVFHGEKDSDVPYLVSVKLVDRLKDAGVSTELHVFEGAGHGFGMAGKGPEAAWPDQCAAWLKERAIIPQ